MWEFDVISSTHDLVKEGNIDAFRSRLLLSEEEFTPEEAYLFAAQWGCARGRMCTEVLWRI